MCRPLNQLSKRPGVPLTPQPITQTPVSSTGSLHSFSTPFLNLQLDEMSRQKTELEGQVRERDAALRVARRESQDSLDSTAIADQLEKIRQEYKENVQVCPALQCVLG